MNLNKDDISWLKNNYPGLIITSLSPLRISGEFKFKAAYNTNLKEYIINPVEEDPVNNLITDVYDILIESDENSFPKVTETGEKIKKYAVEENIELIDLHIADSNEVCLVGALDRNPQISFRQFIREPLLQYFYDQSYFRINGKWPRGTYEHYDLGLFENYYHLSNHGYRRETFATCLEFLNKFYFNKYHALLEKKENLKGHSPCLCKSGKKFRDCHPEAFKGLWLFKNNYKNSK